MFVLLSFCVALGCWAFVPNLPAAARSSRSRHSAATCRVSGTWGACGANEVHPGRGFTIWRALSAGNEEEGGGGHDTRESAASPAAEEIRAVEEAMRAVEGKIAEVEEEIRAVAAKIDAVDAALAGGSDYLGITERDALLKEKDQLRREKDQLRRKEEQLRRKEEQLRRKEEQLREGKASGTANVHHVQIHSSLQKLDKRIEGPRARGATLLVLILCCRSGGVSAHTCTHV